jgi:hypothetical protein
MQNSPRSPVTADVREPSTAIVTPGSAAPDWSITVPATAQGEDCAAAGTDAARRRRATRQTVAISWWPKRRFLAVTAFNFD